MYKKVIQYLLFLSSSALFVNCAGYSSQELESNNISSSDVKAAGLTAKQKEECGYAVCDISDRMNHVGFVLFGKEIKNNNTGKDLVYRIYGNNKSCKVNNNKVPSGHGAKEYRDNGQGFYLLELLIAWTPNFMETNECNERSSSETAQPTQCNNFSYCKNSGGAAGDFDGDGWGYENGQSCIVKQSSADRCQ